MTRKLAGVHAEAPPRRSFARITQAPIETALVQLGRYALLKPEAHSDDSWSRVREAQRLLPTYIERTAVVPAIDLELSDAIHIGTHGLRRLGRRLASVALADAYGASTSPGIRLDRLIREDDVITVRFSGVTGVLHASDPAGRVGGFAITDAHGVPADRRIFHARVAGHDPASVELLLEPGSSLTGRVSHGWGLSPFCQLIDDADMAVPAFGPLSPATS